MIFLLAPLLLLVVAQFIACIGSMRELSSHSRRGSGVPIAPAVFAVAAVCGSVCLGCAGSCPREVLILFSLLFVLSSLMAPLLVARALGQFHAVHHLVRAAVVVVALVLYWVYVNAHR